MASGRVKWFNSKKGFGFITLDSGQEVFVHHTAILGQGFRTLDDGEFVNFEITDSGRGLKAQDVQRHPVGQ